MTTNHQPINIAQALRIDTKLAIIDAEALLQFTLKKNRSYLYTWPEKNLTTNESKQYTRLVESRLAGQPIAYLLGEKEFYSRSFYINKHTLIPRPETELIIDAVKKLNKCYHFSDILDLGTGSGIIAITIDKEINPKSIDAVDINKKTLAVCDKNITSLKSKVKTYLSNWFEAIPLKKYDLIISNPPYISAYDTHLTRGDLRFEPPIALKSDNNGLKDLETIVSNSNKYLKENGLLMVEHGFEQAEEVFKLFKLNNFSQITQLQDFNNNDRITFGTI